MEGISLLLPVLIIAVMLYFLRLPWMLLRHSKDVIWIWALIAAGCCLGAYALNYGLKKVEPYPHIGNYIIVILIISWIYFFLIVRLTGLTLRDKKFSEGDGLSIANEMTSTIHGIWEALELITFIAGAICAYCFLPDKWGMVIGFVIFIVGMGLCYGHQSSERDYYRLRFLFRLNPYFSERLESALQLYKDRDDCSFPSQIKDKDGNNLCSAGLMNLYIRMKKDKSNGDLCSYIFLILVVACMFAFGERRTSTVYVSTSETAKTYHYDKNCKGLKKTKASIETISLDELDDYEYYDETYDDYLERTPCKICTKEIK